MTANDPLRALIVSYAPREARAGFAALLALDDALGQVLRTTREPMVGQMRLAWWREALVRLDEAPPPGEPVLVALAGAVLPAGVRGARLADLVDGWEPLFGDVDVSAVDAHDERRGAALFAIAGRVLGQEMASLDDAGRGWALADLAANLSDTASAKLAHDRATPLLDAAVGQRWPRRLRALGALVLVARRERVGPGGVLRLGWHRLTGR